MYSIYYLAHCGYIRRPLAPQRRTEPPIQSSFWRWRYAKVGCTSTRLSRVVLRCFKVDVPAPPSLCCRRHRGCHLAWCSLVCAVVANSEARVAGRRGDEGSREKDGAPGEQTFFFCSCPPPPPGRFSFLWRVLVPSPSSTAVRGALFCSFVLLLLLINARPSRFLFFFVCFLFVCVAFVRPAGDCRYPRIWHHYGESPGPSHLWSVALRGELTSKHPLKKIRTLRVAWCEARRNWRRSPACLSRLGLLQALFYGISIMYLYTCTPAKVQLLFL